ncbi:hypothetical protein BDQ12DRAFT_511656 [Crucibulum laeve]|uniref:PHD-type domain-containing protein n=1 Tax=Crucibulum laeve TaxID=68775 RepID=A0A5C3M302_9AGAR|nr:hypothetical protein BDQ12DRAFT_511656 [Crucibulum laeve]
MSTRSRTRAATAAAAGTSKPQENPISKPKSTRSKKAPTQNEAVADVAEKENTKTKTTTKAAPKKGKGKIASKTANSTLCTCSKGDDGSPMVHCAECKNWYHFSCVDLTEDEADDINVYICPSCTESSGRRTASEYIEFVSYYTTTVACAASSSVVLEKTCFCNFRLMLCDPCSIR